MDIKNLHWAAESQNSLMGDGSAGTTYIYAYCSNFFNNIYAYCSNSFNNIKLIFVHKLLLLQNIFKIYASEI